jgi:S1-C subfamily serine protease
MIAPSPGGSPLVVRVQPGSPADRAGIQEGDFILSVGDKKIDSLETLQQAIAVPGDGETLKVTTWRAGEEQLVSVSFAPRERSARQEALESHPWLGIMVGQSDQRGAEISRVYVGSPADKAGLRAGDRVLKVDGESVATPERVANYVKSTDIGKDIELVIERDGKEQTIVVTVGNLEDFHERLFGERFRSKFDDYHQMYDPDFDGVPEQLFGVEAEDVRSLLGELMEELKELREEVRQSQRDASTKANTESDETS